MNIVERRKNWEDHLIIGRYMSTDIALAEWVQKEFKAYYNRIKSSTQKGFDRWIIRETLEDGTLVQIDTIYALHFRSILDRIYAYARSYMGSDSYSYTNIDIHFYQGYIDVVLTCYPSVVHILNNTNRYYRYYRITPVLKFDFLDEGEIP